MGGERLGVEKSGGSSFKNEMKRIKSKGGGGDEADRFFSREKSWSRIGLLESLIGCVFFKRRHSYVFFHFCRERRVAIPRWRHPTYRR